VGPYHVAYRISPGIGKAAFRNPARAQDPLRTLLVLVAGDLDATVSAAQSLGEILEVIDDPAQPEFVIHIDPARISALAALAEVLWVEELPETFALNNETRWVVQSNQEDVVPVWNHGIFGEGQILAEMDSGLDFNSCWFRDPDGDLPGPNHRKVIDYQTWGGNPYDGCDMGHGTHVAGTAVGDQSAVNPGNINYNGVAYKAKIAFQDVGLDDEGSCSGFYLNIPASLTMALTDAYSLGARVHTNSWGSHVNEYNAHARNVDNFMWSHPDLLICISNGNDGPMNGTVTAPATAKNCVSVGATNQAPNQDQVPSYSSRGPAYDNRIKPTVLAPGGSSPLIYSANNHPGNPPSPTCSVEGFTGTSMAAPAVAGGALLVRDYFAQGFYPVGEAGGDPLTPSAALVKAMLVNSGRDLALNGADQPNKAEGWGRILLNDALYFAGDTRELHVEQDDVGLATGEQVSFTYPVDSSAEPLEITLVWTDYPAAINANPALVNDLNLTVTSPTGVTYLGNFYSGGQSVGGGFVDHLNVEECVRRNAPVVGDWTITVTAEDVPEGGHQPFALVTTGSFSGWPLTPAGLDEKPALERVRLGLARPNPTSGNTTLGFSLTAAGKARLAIYDASGRRIALLADGTFGAGARSCEWNGRTEQGTPVADGVYFYRLEADEVVISRKLTFVR
jgi:hypothetical protein